MTGVEVEIGRKIKELIGNKFGATLLLLGGHKIEGEIIEVKNKIVIVKLESNSAQTHKGFAHIKDIVGVEYREE